MRLLAAIALAGSLASDVLTPQLADAFERKIVLVQAQAGEKAARDRAVTFSQAETNSYLKFNAGSLLPTGLTQPEVTLLGKGRVSAKAIVDLDVVRQKQSSGAWLDPTSYLTGKLEVSATGHVVTWDGKGKVELETAYLSGLPIPRSFLNQMVNFFTRTADNPKGSTVDDTFELPASIRRIDVEQSRFITHQ
ncbi:MAG: hypothetical protein FJW22_00295 [Acidimicrobiia bacterium]|nr:hypothetical protein [Acidimicrobiia bacterium]